MQHITDGYGHTYQNYKAVIACFSGRILYPLHDLIETVLAQRGRTALDLAETYRRLL